MAGSTAIARKLKDPNFTDFLRFTANSSRHGTRSASPEYRQNCDDPRRTRNLARGELDHRATATEDKDEDQELCVVCSRPRSRHHIRRSRDGICAGDAAGKAAEENCRAEEDGEEANSREVAAGNSRAEGTSSGGTCGHDSYRPS